MLYLPQLHLTATVPRRAVDEPLGLDQFARSALETYRNGYNPLPTSNVNEFAAFFSKKNYEKLYGEIKRQSGYEPDENEVLETMHYAFQMSPPRSDEMDMRRELFTPRVTASYVAELNKIVLERAVETTIQANKLWDHYAKYRNGPVGWGDDPDMHFGVDTRTRLNVSKYDFTWLQP